VTLRPPIDADADRVASLLSRHAPEPVPRDNVLRDWRAPDTDLERDVRVGEHEYGMIYVDEQRRAWLGLGGEVSDDLVEWLEAQARARNAERVLARGWERDEGITRALDRAGFERRPGSLRMRTTLDGDRVVTTPPPAGITLRPFRSEDERAVYETHRETFADMSEPATFSYEDWRHYLLQSPAFAPELWFLAEAGEQLAGITLCHPHTVETDTGVIGVVGVRRPWRRRGVGRALVEHAFAELARRDFRAAILGVEENSPTRASRLYETVGMRVTHRGLRYEKALT
jgi:ribosomal protein S18 acetylase RimI-like enzyme